MTPIFMKFAALLARVLQYPIVEQAAEALSNGLAGLIREHAHDPAAMTSLAQALEDKAEAVGKAVKANTGEIDKDAIDFLDAHFSAQAGAADKLKAAVKDPAVLAAIQGMIDKATAPKPAAE